MGSSFLTRGGESICLIRQEHQSSYFVYELKKTEKYGFQFYGTFHKFEIDLSKDLPFSEQLYGFLGSAADLSGRASTRGVGKERKLLISSSGEKMITLDNPVYSFAGEFNESKLSKFLVGFSREKKDVPYASISTSSSAMSDAGDDFYLNTLFFMTGGYGILTEISAVAGRDVDDCCSPEFYYEANKVRLEKNPLRIIQEKDVISEADIVAWRVFTNPKTTKSVSVRFDKNPKKLNSLLDELFLKFRPVSKGKF